MGARTIINLPRRFPYAFIPEISRQLGVGLNAVQGVVAVQAGAGVIAPLFTPLSERYGRKYTLLFALGLLIAGAVVGALWTQYTLFAAAMLAMGVAKIIFDPAMHAYIGDQVPYAQRGAAIGLAEVSWSLSLVIAAPGAALLLTHFGLRAVFVSIAILAVIFWWLVARRLPPDRPAPTPDGEEKPAMGWGLLVRTPAALGALAYAFLLTGANEMFLIVYAAWMEVSFGLVLTALGLVTVVIAVAEVVGEVAVIGLADRVGKQRLAVSGAVLAGLCYLALPALGLSLVVALALIFLLFIGVETAIVATFPLFTEVLPQARSAMMTTVWGAHALGRLGGAVLGGALYQATGSFTTAMLLACGMTALCAAILWRFVPDNG